MKSMRWAFLLMLASAGVIAQDVKIVGLVDQPIQLPSKRTGVYRATPLAVRHISLLNVELSESARQKIDSRAEDALKAKEGSLVGLTGIGQKIQLGMGNVPVLDQGSYGSCVTFANTGAVDAIINKGDYISQLCSLQLGRYLEENGYNPSGWDGSLGGIVLNQMSTFGLISKSQQTSKGCGGVMHYPLDGMDSAPGTEMTPVAYHQLSEEMISHGVAWSALLDDNQVFQDKINLTQTVAQVKSALNAGDRLTFGILLPDTNKGVAGAVGKYHVTYDSWLLTPEIVEDMKSQTDLPGHEMIITGYDDDAVAIDDHGRSHSGLFTLRNSWGANVGDRGNFYMSYDYFKTLALEVQRIRSIA